MLRETSKNLPHATALEWSPSHNLKSLKRKMLSQQQSGDKSTENGGQANQNATDKVSTTSSTSLSDGSVGSERFVSYCLDGMQDSQSCTLISSLKE